MSGSHRNNEVIHLSFFTSPYRAYFSRLTRERRTKGNEKETTVSTGTDDEDLQLQEDEDESDFDSALTVTEAYDLLDNAIHVLDDMIQQQQPTVAATTAAFSINPPGRTTRSERIITGNTSSNK